MVIQKAYLGLLKFNKLSRSWNEEIAWAYYPANDARGILLPTPETSPCWRFFGWSVDL